MALKAWNNFKYDISFIDKNDMERKHILTNKENLSDQIAEIFDKGGFDVKIDLTDNENNDTIHTYHKYWNGEVR